MLEKSEDLSGLGEVSGLESGLLEDLALSLVSLLSDEENELFSAHTLELCLH